MRIGNRQENTFVQRSRASPCALCHHTHIHAPALMPNRVDAVLLMVIARRRRRSRCTGLSDQLRSSPAQEFANESVQCFERCGRRGHRGGAVKKLSCSVAHAARHGLAAVSRLYCYRKRTLQRDQRSRGRLAALVGPAASWHAASNGHAHTGRQLASETPAGCWPLRRRRTR